MKKLYFLFKMHHTYILLLTLIVLGTVLRILPCFWGYPYQLHPDEWAIVDNAIDMISRNSYIAYIYNRPDQFEIKICAVLFQIFSYLKYHVSANIAFRDHAAEFYIIARMFTAFFGVITIVLAYKFVEKIAPRAKILTATMVAIFPIFVQHSAFATPDIVLTFFVLLIAYISFFYIQKPSLLYLGLMCVVMGIGITIKYTCAIACLYIVFLVYIEKSKMDKSLSFLKIGAFCAATVIFVCFLCAPNLFINIDKTFITLCHEARSTHLGADGLGFFGNFQYYLSTFLSASGYESAIFILAGTIFCLIKRNVNVLPMFLGLLFWVCTSVLALHWERWGMPIYIFFIILLAIGIPYLYHLSTQKWLKSVISILSAIILLNNIVSSILLIQNSLTVDARVAALQFCTEKGITRENTLYDGYTPLSLSDSEVIDVSFDENGNIILPDGIRYLIISSNMYSRFYAEPKRYVDQINKYENIQNKMKLIYCAGGTYYKHSKIGIVNIFYVIKALISHKRSTVAGPVIKIYRVGGDHVS